MQSRLVCLRESRDCTCQSVFGIEITRHRRLLWPSRKRFVSFIYQPTFDRRGNITGIFVEGIDVTEAVLALRASESELKAVNHRKDEFLAMLAHELRNPLAPITSAAEMLKVVAHGVTRVSKAAEVIDRQAGHLSVLVDDLLDVSRITRGLVELKMGVVDLHAIVDSAVEQARALLESRKHSLVVRHDPSSALVIGDQIRLVQVIVNLVNNAAKYTPDGAAIKLTVHNDGDQVVTTVEDNGIGINADLLPHIFDLLTQAARTLDRLQGGLGIGLALVKTIVDLHGGKATVFSDGPGAGSKVTVTLPCAGPTKLSRI